MYSALGAFIHSPYGDWASWHHYWTRSTDISDGRTLQLETSDYGTIQLTSMNCTETYGLVP